MKMILLSCLILRTLEHGIVRVSGNELLVYTNVEIDDLKISLNKEYDDTEGTLKFKCITLPEGSFISVKKFSVILPNEDKGKICFQTKDKEQPEIYLAFEREIIDNATTYIFYQPTKDNTKENTAEDFVKEANYMYIPRKEQYVIVCVISDNFENKLELDLKMEINQKNTIYNLQTCCDSILQNFILNIAYLKRNINFLKKYKAVLTEFLNELLFRITYLFSLSSAYVELCETSLLSYKIRFIGITMIKESIYEVIESFYEENIFFYESKLNYIEKIYREYIKNPHNIDFKAFRGTLRFFMENCNDIRKFFKDKSAIEREYIRKRNDFLLKSLKRGDGEELSPQIEKLRIFSENLYNTMIILHFNEIFNFIEEHCINNLFTSIRFTDFRGDIKKIWMDSKYYYKTALDIRGLQTNTPSRYHDNLLKNETFKNLRSANIFSTIRGYKKRIDKLKDSYDDSTKDKYFREIIFKKSKDVDCEYEFWKEVIDENKDVGLFTYEKINITFMYRLKKYILSWIRSIIYTVYD